MADTSTKKRYSNVAPEPVDSTGPTKNPSMRNSGPKDEGQMRGDGTQEKFAQPLQAVSAKIRGMDGLHNDIGEQSGFITDGYLDKQGTPYGEAAKFNFLPPGMDISNQENAEIHTMPMKRITETSYPGDGWEPKPRDIVE